MFYYIKKKIAAKLAFVIFFVVTVISIISTLYFNHINKKNLTEYLNISLSNAIYFAQQVYGQPLWDYNENEINRLSQVILKNKLITAINVFETGGFLIGNLKRAPRRSEVVQPRASLPAATLTQNILLDTSTEYEVETLKTPYLITTDSQYIKKITGDIILREKTVGKFELFYTEEFMKNAIDMSKNRMILSFVVIALIIITVVMFGVTKINKPILELAKLSSKIAQDNDFSIKIEKTNRIDEVGILFNGFVKMVEQIRLKEIERNTIYNTLQNSLERFRSLFSNLQKAIDNDDYSLRMKPESEKDELAIALNKIMNTLEQADKTKQTQNWLKNGQAELSGIIGRQQDILKISSAAINFIAAYINAKVGTFFVKDEVQKDFRMVSSYAFRTRKSVTSRFSLGEGLTGQAALEKKTLIFTEVPDNYLKIESSLGNVAPRNIIVLPLIYEDDVKGVIELGSTEIFSDLQIEFLDNASETLAVSINGAMFNEKLSILLTQTREQAEELKAQQEELKSTNEELEGQTRILKASEEKLNAQQEELRAQQEELRASNDELEDKNQILQLQKQDIEKNNAILKTKQIEIEEKAEQLRIETKYKSEFLANMSHELRTPLNSLLILANMLAENEEANLTPDQVESAASIYRSGQNLLHLINNILDLSKIEAKKIELNISKCSIHEIGSHFKSEFLHMAKAKGIEFKVNIDESMPDTIMTDVHRVEQIIRNLIGNAIKFTETGTITLNLKKPASDTLIKVRLPHAPSGKERLGTPDTDSQIIQLTRENAIAISVNDTGSGIPADKIDAVFEAFKQVDGSTSRKHDGTGLGLSISKELATLLGGQITLESELGKGSTFTLYIPEKIDVDQKNLSLSSKPGGTDKQSVVSEPSEVKNPFTEATSTQMQGDKIEDKTLVLRDPKHEVKTKAPLQTLSTTPPRSPYESEVYQSAVPSDEASKTMLIIEDDPEFGRILSNFFSKHGYQSVLAKTGEEGIKYIIENKPTAIILDIALPGIDGWTVMNELKTNPDTRHIPVHIMSGYDQSRKGLEKGAVGYLTKPVSSSDLNKALSKIENILTSDVKNLLVVEDNKELQMSILKLMSTDDIKVTAVGTGEEAISLLKERDFDCMILDLGLPDISGFELMDRIRKDSQIEMLPVIIFTGRDLTPEETHKLEQYSASIVLKNAVSMERLIDETALFLHRVEREMPENQKKMIKKVRDQQTYLKDKKVLVVDDDMRNAFALNKFLKSKGMDVSIANNGEKALKFLQDGVIPDVILMDIMMPVMDGYETMRQIRSKPEFQKLPIIALTAKAMSSDRDECIRCGASDYLSKPLDTAKLLTLLRVWLYK
ncbi:MAG: response regulator [Desulfamplus sp.]|nr:response regulator [Desulfamplus sp.]